MIIMESGRGGGDDKQSETRKSFSYRPNLRQVLKETVDYTPTTNIKNQIERKLTKNDDDDDDVVVEDDDVVKVKEQKKTDVVEDDDVGVVNDVEIKQNKKKNDGIGSAMKKKKMIIKNMERNKYHNNIYGNSKPNDKIKIQIPKNPIDDTLVTRIDLFCLIVVVVLLRCCYTTMKERHNKAAEHNKKSTVTNNSRRTLQPSGFLGRTTTHTQNTNNNDITTNSTNFSSTSLFEQLKERSRQALSRRNRRQPASSN
mmetsp:Transcript_39237/g.44135  ORF Transcript_39237/g.44135 Transcript_39237/m.44135 type:complete len:255 (+) Transcript_39237:48-812(+)